MEMIATWLRLQQRYQNWLRIGAALFMLHAISYQVGFAAQLTVVEPTPSEPQPAKLVFVDGGISLTHLEQSDSHWSEILLLAKPRLASGEWSLLSESIRTSSTQFTLVILAKTERIGQEGLVGPPHHRLKEVGIGYAIEQVGGLVTLRTQTLRRRQRISLDFVAGHVLSENESSLKALELVASDSNLLIFDAPALVHRHGQHGSIEFVILFGRTQSVVALECWFGCCIPIRVDPNQWTKPCDGSLLERERIVASMWMVRNSFLDSQHASLRIRGYHTW